MTMSGTRRRLILVAALALIATLVSAPAVGAAPGPHDESSVIVVLQPHVDAAAGARALANRHGGEARLVFDEVLGGFEFAGTTPAIEGLSRSPEVRAIVPNDEFSLVDVAGMGIFRIEADLAITDPAGPYRGSGARVAIIDSGIDTDHPDLVPNIDFDAAFNCQESGQPPEDQNGHGTHVAGVAAAAFNSDGYGVVGVAPSASLVPIKSFDANGFATTAQIVCGLNHLAGLTAQRPMPTVVNMSFADSGTDSACDDADVSDVLHEALCDLVDAGTANGVSVIPVAAAGNANVNIANTIPAAFSDVITVSALGDHDGAPGGSAGCVYVPLLFNTECDDTLASFSNYGAGVDVAAPGVEIYSSLPGGHGTMSGTSMAAPHVTGVVAAMLAEHAALDLATAKGILRETGECPDGSVAGPDGGCEGQGQWLQTANKSLFDPVSTKPDPDGIAEPLVNAARAASAADAAGDPPPPPPPPPADEAPTVAIDVPSAGEVVTGTVTVAGTSNDDDAVTEVEVFINGLSLGATTPDGNGDWSLPWDTTAGPDGGYTLVARATDSIGQQTDSDAVQVDVDNSTGSTTMHVAGLVGSASGSNGKKWTASATVDIVDSNGAPVQGAGVVMSVQSATAALAAPGGNSRQARRWRWRWWRWRWYQRGGLVCHRHRRPLLGERQAVR